MDQKKSLPRALLARLRQASPLPTAQDRARHLLERLEAFSREKAPEREKWEERVGELRNRLLELLRLPRPQEVQDLKKTLEAMNRHVDALLQQVESLKREAAANPESPDSVAER